MTTKIVQNSSYKIDDCSIDISGSVSKTFKCLSRFYRAAVALQQFKELKFSCQVEIVRAMNSDIDYQNFPIKLLEDGQLRCRYLNP